LGFVNYATIKWPLQWGRASSLQNLKGKSNASPIFQIFLGLGLGLRKSRKEDPWACNCGMDERGRALSPLLDGYIPGKQISYLFIYLLLL
jgi:hypothetical protein